MRKQSPAPWSIQASSPALRSGMLEQRQTSSVVCCQLLCPVMFRPVDLYAIAWQAAVASAGAERRWRAIADSN